MALWGGLVKSMHTGMSPESFQRAFNSASQRFMADLAAGRSLEDATRRLTDDHIFILFKDDEIRHLKSVMETQRWGDNPRFHPPTLVAKVEAQVNSTRAVQATDAMHQVGVGVRRQQELADALIEYDDLFPAQHGDEAKTKRAELLKKWDPDSVHVAAANINDLPVTQPPSGGWGEMPLGGGGGGGFSGGSGGFAGGGGGGTKPAPHVGGGGMGGFARARSFAGLRGFSRIGGVLIGTEPEIDLGNPADFSDISWQADTQGVNLSLTRHRDGKIFELGPFRPDIIEKALAYAADNRKVTVTMITAPPLAELKVFVHPALIDSRAGCRAVELDRFVDIYTGKSEKRSDAEKVFLLQDGLYRYAQAIRVKSIIEQVRHRGMLDKAVEDQLAGLERRAENSIRGLEQKFGDIPVSFLSDPEQSPITVKQAYYDESLVNDLKACGNQPSKISELGRCVAGRNNTLPYKGSRWYYPAPEHQIWSGVRELPYAVDGDLRFLTAPTAASKDKDAWPLQFMLQVAFTSPPGFIEDERQTENFVDADPWEFPDLKSFIGLSVLEGITKDPKNAKVFAEMREFTLLQRLFRAALDGKLGASFPIEKLVALTKEAQKRSANQQVRTPRWNPRPGNLEVSFAQDIEGIRKEIRETNYVKSDDDEKWIRKASDAMGQCVQLVFSQNPGKNGSVSLNPLAISKIPRDVWEKSCSFPWIGKVPEGLEKRQANLLQFAADESQIILHARELREAMGVSRDQDSAEQCTKLD